METPGSYEKLLARELAQAVCLNYTVIIDASHQLAELGNTPGVMDEGAHLIFTGIAREVEGVIMQNRYEGMEALLNHWKDHVLAAWPDKLGTRLTANESTTFDRCLQSLHQSKRKRRFRMIGSIFALP